MIYVLKLRNYKNWVLNFESLLKYKRQMTGVLRYATQVYTICYP